MVRGVVLAEILLGKLPAIFLRYFRREGVVKEFEKLASQPEYYPRPLTLCCFLEKQTCSSLFASWLRPAKVDEAKAKPAPASSLFFLARRHQSDDNVKEVMHKWIVEHAQKLIGQHFHKAPLFLSMCCSSKVLILPQASDDADELTKMMALSDRLKSQDNIEELSLTLKEIASLLSTTLLSMSFVLSGSYSLPTFFHPSLHR